MNVRKVLLTTFILLLLIVLGLSQFYQEYTIFQRRHLYSYKYVYPRLELHRQELAKYNILILGDEKFLKHYEDGFKKLGVNTTGVTYLPYREEDPITFPKINIMVIQGSRFKEYYGMMEFREFIRKLLESQAMVYVYGPEASLLFKMVAELGVASFPREISVRVGAGYIRYNEVYDSIFFGANPEEILDFYLLVLDTGLSI